MHRTLHLLMVFYTKCRGWYTTTFQCWFCAKYNYKVNECEEVRDWRNYACIEERVAKIMSKLKWKAICKKKLNQIYVKHYIVHPKRQYICPEFYHVQLVPLTLCKMRKIAVQFYPVQCKWKPNDTQCKCKCKANDTKCNAQALALHWEELQKQFLGFQLQ